MAQRISGKNVICIGGDYFTPTVPTYSDVRVIQQMVKNGIITRHDTESFPMGFAISNDSFLRPDQAHIRPVAFVKTFGIFTTNNDRGKRVGQISEGKLIEGTNIHRIYGYCPKLIPVKKNRFDEYELDDSLRKFHRNGDMLQGGTLFVRSYPVEIPTNTMNTMNVDYFNVPCFPESEYMGFLGDIALGDTSDGVTKGNYAINWTFVNGCLIADRYLLYTSFQELFDAGLV